MISKYVDDMNTAVEVIPKGYRWKNVESEDRQLVWSESMAEIDRKEGIPDSERTMQLIRELADVLMPGLKFTVDVVENHASGKVPMLDLTVWTEVGDESKGTGDSIRLAPKCFTPQGHTPGKPK